MGVHGPARLWTSVAGTARAGRARAVPGGTGVGWRAVWRLRAPTPPAGRCAPVLVERSFTDRAVCCRVASRASSPAQAASGPAGEAGGRAALPCVPWQPLAAAGCCSVFLPPQEAQGNPGGATSRLGASALPIARNGSPLDMALLRQDWGRAGRRKKNHKCRSNRPRRGQGPYRMFYSPASGQERALRGEHRHPQVHRCSTQPSEKHLTKRFFFFQPHDKPRRRARARGSERRHL
jgi:hypothetical protein